MRDKPLLSWEPRGASLTICYPLVLSRPVWSGGIAGKGDRMAEKNPGNGGGRKPTGNTGRNRNAYCSFCRKSYRDVGPLVEGPGDVYICGECIELCQSIIDQEKRRRGGSKAPFSNIPAPRSIKERLDPDVNRPPPAQKSPSGGRPQPKKQAKPG